ncbi:MAG: NUDIX hydrolase, partial [Lachnospiraceae bacterium]|nr:NUDIX hydrolase [Lachnospiraceae bacterium]
INKVTTEFTAGGIEHDDDKEYGSMEDSAEDALEAAKRELLEETGYEADNWKHLLTIPANATIADNYAHLFLATGCKKVSDQSLDETEFLNVVKYSEDEIEDMIKSGEFEQIVHITAWFLALRAQG